MSNSRGANMTIVILAFATMALSLLGLVSLRMNVDTTRQNAILEQRLFNERLKREYFEWRETNALGHSRPATDFPRAQELQSLNAN